MSLHLNAVFKRRMTIFNLNNYYSDRWLRIRGNVLNNQTNINIITSIMYDFFLISTKVIGKKIERQKEPQHPNFFFENFHKFHTIYFWELFNIKIVKMTFTFMLLFSQCASLDHHFMHYLYSFLWESWPFLEIRHEQNTNVQAYFSCPGNSTEW